VSSNQQVPDPEVPARARPRSYSASYKARILEEYDSLDKAGKGALLRREGLYTSLISAWRQQRDQGARSALAKPAGRPPADVRDREIVRLRRENQRLHADLDTARKVIDVRGRTRVSAHEQGHRVQADRLVRSQLETRRTRCRLSRCPAREPGSGPGSTSIVGKPNLLKLPEIGCHLESVVVGHGWCAQRLRRRGNRRAVAVREVLQVVREAFHVTRDETTSRIRM
jgi:transposase-like protein